MDVILCCYKQTDVETHIRAYIDDGQLTIAGQDLGSMVEDHYEYFYSLSKGDTKKLHKLLKEDSNSNKGLLELMQIYFSGMSCCLEFRNYCQNNSLEYKFFSY
jgi:hypothetical protein